MIFPWYFHDISMIFPWYFHDISMDISWAANSSWFDFISKICIKIASPSCNSEPSLATPKSRISPHPRDKQKPGFFKFGHTKHPRPWVNGSLHYSTSFRMIWGHKLVMNQKDICHCQPRPFLSPVHTNHVGRCPSLASDRVIGVCPAVHRCSDVRHSGTAFEFCFKGLLLPIDHLQHLNRQTPLALETLHLSKQESSKTSRLQGWLPSSPHISFSSAASNAPCCAKMEPYRST